MLVSVIVRVAGKPSYQMFCVQLLEKNNSDKVTLNGHKLKMAAESD